MLNDRPAPETTLPVREKLQAFRWIEARRVQERPRLKIPENLDWRLGSSRLADVDYQEIYQEEAMYRDIRPWQQIGQVEWALPGTPWTVVKDEDGGWICRRDGQQQGRFAKFTDARRHVEIMVQADLNRGPA
jgi:hypothetical protein